MSRARGRAGMRTGMVALAVILLSESVFFGTLLAAYAALRSENSLQLPQGPERLLIPAANSLVFLLSVIPARLAARRGSRPNSAELWLTCTFALGMLFVAGQIYEFSHSGMRVNDVAFGGVFFALMGFHGLHVIAGMMLLAINLVRARLGDFTAGGREALAVGSAFWYYVVAVWLVLFASLYLL